MKRYTTQIKAVDPEDGRLKLWAGPPVHGESFEDAVKKTKKGRGYLEVLGETKPMVNEVFDLNEVCSQCNGTGMVYDEGR